MPNVMMRGDQEQSWTRQCCLAIVVDADIDKGITLMGQSPCVDIKGDIELSCINIDNYRGHSGMGNTVLYREIMHKAMEDINAGCRDRMEHGVKGGSMAACAFG